MATESWMKARRLSFQRVSFGRGHATINSSLEGTKITSEDLMAARIEGVLNFKAVSSPAYMAMTYLKDPVEHAFDFTGMAQKGMQK